MAVETVTHLHISKLPKIVEKFCSSNCLQIVKHSILWYGHL